MAHPSEILSPAFDEKTAQPGQGYLARLESVGFSEVHRLDRRLTITLGRAHTNTIVIRDEGASRVHARVFRANAHWYIEDQDSTNGTRVNDERITAPTVLHQDDRIRIGQTTLVFLTDPRILSGSSVAMARDGAELLSLREFETETQLLIDLDAELRSSGFSSGQWQCLFDAAMKMGAAQDLDELADVVLKFLAAETAAQAGAIVKVAGESHPQVLASFFPENGEYRLFSPDLYALLRRKRQALFLQADLQLDQYGVPGPGRTVICVPLLCDGNIAGVLHLYTEDALRTLTADDFHLAIAIARQFHQAYSNLQKRMSLCGENEHLRATLRMQTEIIGCSPAVHALREQITLANGANSPALICGEGGVGKELAARAMHYSSGRRNGPFLSVNCFSMSGEELEAELRGTEHMTYTGQCIAQPGKLEIAHGGTLFLTDIGEAPAAVQETLYRVLAGEPLQRLGGRTPIPVDVRLIAATTRELEEDVTRGYFRGDLFFRLQIQKIRIPPLRERPEDIQHLANYFLDLFARDTGRSFRGFSPPAMQKLHDYPWPGNVRELRNAIERAVVAARSNVIEADDLVLTAQWSQPPSDPDFEAISLSEMECRHIEMMLRHTGWNKSQAAILLGIERSTLDRKIRRYNLAPPPG